MDRKRFLLISATALVAAISVMVWLFHWLGAAPKVAAGELGITWVPLSQTSSCCYGLKASTGALVTAVNKDSPADQAGLTPGDVIVSCDGNPVCPQYPLLGSIRKFSAGESLNLGVSGAAGERTVEIPAATR